MTPFTMTRRVEFGDTDMAGIMHFVNFFRFMEAAETAFLRERGLTVHWRESGGKLGFPRVSAQCEYRAPAFFEDVLTITVTVEKVGRKSVTYLFHFNNQRGELIAVGRLTSVFCRTTAPDQIESLEIPPEIRTKLET